MGPKNDFIIAKDEKPERKLEFGSSNAENVPNEAPPHRGDG